MPDKRDANDVFWYVMRGHSSCTSKIRTTLEEKGVEYFQPRRYVIETKNGRKKKVLKYVLKDFFFVHSSRKNLDAFIGELSVRFNYYYDICSHVQNDCMIVPNGEMENFILVATAYDDNPTYLPANEVNLNKGDRVRIVGGYFDGYEGTYMQVKRGQKKRLVVCLDGILAVTAYVDPDYVQLLK